MSPSFLPHRYAGMVVQIRSAGPKPSPTVELLKRLDKILQYKRTTCHKKKPKPNKKNKKRRARKNKEKEAGDSSGSSTDEDVGCYEIDV